MCHFLFQVLHSDALSKLNADNSVILYFYHSFDARLVCDWRILELHHYCFNTQ